MSQSLRNHLAQQALHHAVAMDALKDQPIIDASQFIEAQADERGVLAITNWCDDGQSDDLEGATLLDLLDGHMFAAFDLDGDGDISEEEMVYQERILSGAADFMLSLGILSDDIDSLFGYDADDEDEVSEAAEVAERVREALKQALPSETDELDDLISGFVFDDAAVAMDAANSPRRFAKSDAAGKKHQYRRVRAVRGGKVTFAAKRITAGAFKMTAKAKAHLRRLANKAWTSARKNKLRKSMRIRKNRGL
ncbi:MAG: hypothetical protein VXW65_00340 [Pseudomonadota bacterium]|nr:hypothetical protein [Pseudomonadota bacterium]